MAHVVWKFVRGMGPYAYLRQSVRVDGRVRTRELGYLGCWRPDGTGTVNPGSVVPGPGGEEVRVPEFSPSIQRRLPTTAPPGPEGRLPTTEPPSAELPGKELPTTDPMVADGELPTTPAGAGTGLPTTDSVALAEELPITCAGPEEELPTTVAGARAEPAPEPAPVRPHRLSDGSWGVVSQQQLAMGDLVTVTTASGQSWTATVTEVLEPVRRGFVARTSGRPQPRR